MNAQPPPPPPPPPPSEPNPPRAGSPQAIPAYRGVSDDSPGDPGNGKAGGGLRVLAGVGVVVLLFAAAIFAIVFADIGSTDTCESVRSGEGQLNDDLECYDGSSSTKTIALVLGWPGTVALAAAAVLSLMFTIRGRGGRPLLYALGAGIVLVGLSLIIG